MALHDVSKGEMDRSNPMPNMHGKIIPEAVKAHQTLSTSVALDTANQRIAFKNNMILFYDDQNRVSSVYGYIPGYNSTVPVLIIAKYGYDVFSDVLGLTPP